MRFSHFSSPGLSQLRREATQATLAFELMNEWQRVRYSQSSVAPFLESFSISLRTIVLETMIKSRQIYIYSNS